MSGLAQAGKCSTAARPLCMGYRWMSRCHIIFVVFPKLFSQLKGHVTFLPEGGRKLDSLSVR